MSKVDVGSNPKFKIPYKGKNLINKNQNEIIDSSNNYELQKNYYKEDSSRNKDIKNKNQNIALSERSPVFQTKTKEKNIMSSVELKPKENNNNSITKNNKKQSAITSSFIFYKENKCISILKKLYSSRQKYISILLLICSVLLFLLSFFDLNKQIQNKEGNYLLCNLIIFIFEMVCSGLIFLFHIIYYFINITNNYYLIFLIMSIIILIFSSIYINTYIKKKVTLIEVILYMIYNLLLVLINFIYLFMSYNLVKKNNKVQQNIEDIINFSLRNEKIAGNANKEKKKENKIKAVALVEEEMQNNT